MTPTNEQVEELAERALQEGCYVCDKAEAMSVIQWMLDNGYSRPHPTDGKLEALREAHKHHIRAILYLGTDVPSTADKILEIYEDFYAKLGTRRVTEEELADFIYRDHTLLDIPRSGVSNRSMNACNKLAKAIVRHINGER